MVKKDLLIKWKVIIILTLVISLLSLFNLHIDIYDKDFSETIEINGYAQFQSEDIYSWINNFNPEKATFECTDKIKVSNNIKQLCKNVNKDLYCPTNAMWQTEGHGACLVQWENEAKRLRFGQTK